MGLLRVSPQLRGNPEFQSAIVRLAMWLFGAVYVGLGAATGYYRVDLDYYFALFAGYLALFVAMLVSVVLRPVWPGRCYVGLTMDITGVSLAIFLTQEAISPFYLLYIWIFISAGTRYGRSPLIYASLVSVVAYNLVLVELGEWQRHTFEAVFFLLLLVLLPLYQYSLLRKVQEAREEAERANKAKGDFLAVMTHELRTPLTGLLGMSDLLRATRLDAEQRGYVESITSSAKVLQALVGDVLDMSKIDARKLRLELVPFDLRATVMDVCSALTPQAINKALELIVRFDPGVPASYVGDALRVRQILFNLIGNAVKFTERGEVRVTVARTAGDDADLPQLLSIEVEDTGIGISAERLGTIFESYVQAEESTSRRYGGTGLGTTITRDLTRLMGGRIGAESQLGRGSRFWVRLPLPAPAGGRAAVREPRLRGRRALVYEENATARQLVREMLENEGAQCLAVAEAGEVSGSAGATGGFDLLIIADSPAGKDLGALLRHFERQLGGGCPHLFLTYSARHPESGDGCGNCLDKPLLAEDLIDAVSFVLEPSRRAVGETPPDAEAAGDRPQPLADLSVLVAEDNEIAATVIVTLLAKQGASVTRVRDGVEALTKARQGGFALAFVDLRMPRLDGLEFARAFRAAEPPGARLPIVALTADAAEDAKVHCLAAGMDAFLGKPVKPHELFAMARRFAAGAPPASEAAS
jgi:two-component system sensor histidine kinase RpfC